MLKEYYDAVSINCSKQFFSCLGRMVPPEIQYDKLVSSLGFCITIQVLRDAICNFRKFVEVFVLREKNSRNKD